MNVAYATPDPAGYPCPSCSSPSLCMGDLPRSNLFAGRCLPNIVEGGKLYQCTNCQMGFRYPRLGKSELDHLYAASSPGHWQYAAGTRTDWTLATRMIRERKGEHCDVLDVGCFDGSFLAGLDTTGTRAGIEIFGEAAERARQRGVVLLGSDFASLRDETRKFDAVTAFDVIEHVEHPLQFLKLLRDVVKPSGFVIVSTGNTDAWTWRLMRNHYWYCAIPEHISFLSERWFQNAAAALDLRLSELRRYAHLKGPLPQQAREALSNLTFLVLPRVIGALRRRHVGGAGISLHPEILDEVPPRWMSAKDHILVRLEKPLGHILQ